MILGNLSNVFDGEKTILEAVDNVMSSSNGTYKKPSKFSSILTSLSHYGMNYTEKVYKNMMAVPADKLLQPKDDALLQQTLYGGGLNNWKVKPEEEKSFSEKSLDQKRDILRKMAMQPELEDILDVMANEAIVYDDEEAYIANPFLDTGLIQDLNEKNAEEIRAAMDVAFYKIYMLLDWKTTAWDIFKRYLIDGVLCYEIIYDNLESPKNIIGIVDVDPSTITRSVENEITYWVQFKDVVGRERKLLDAQIIYVKYEDSGVSTRQSYLERLIRPFNLYRIVEQAQVIWTVTQASFKLKFTIPLNGMNPIKGKQTLAEAMNRYKEDITFNTETGELKVNGKTNLPFNKEFWMPSNEAGTPEIEPIIDSGPQLNDSDQIKYFENKLYKISRIPANRFDNEAQATWFGADPTAAQRDEIDYSRFISRLRNVFGEIILKPVRIELALKLPELKNDKRILAALALRWNSYNRFDELMEMEIMTKRMEFIGTMKDGLVETDSEGNETPYFCPKFLVMKYLKMSDADLELNEKLKLEGKKGTAKEGEEGEGEGGEESGGEEDELLGGGEESEGGESESDETSDIDDEMLGDVQPESAETAEA